MSKFDVRGYEEGPNPLSRLYLKTAQLLGKESTAMQLPERKRRQRGTAIVASGFAALGLISSTIVAINRASENPASNQETHFRYEDPTIVNTLNNLFCKIGEAGITYSNGENVYVSPSVDKPYVFTNGQGFTSAVNAIEGSGMSKKCYDELEQNVRDAVARVEGNNDKIVNDGTTIIIPKKVVPVRSA